MIGLSAVSEMSQPNNPATSRHGDDEYEFSDELDGIDWSAVGPIEGDEPKPATTVQAQIQPSIPEECDPPPPTEPPPRPGSSSSSYGFSDLEALDEGELATLDEMEREYGLTTGEHERSVPLPLCSSRVSTQRSFLRGHPQAPLVFLAPVNADSRVKVTRPYHSRNPGLCFQQSKVQRNPRKSCAMRILCKSSIFRS